MFSKFKSKSTLAIYSKKITDVIGFVFFLIILSQRGWKNVFTKIVGILYLRFWRLIRNVPGIS